MNFKNSIYKVLLLTCIILGCSTDEESLIGNWIERSDFDGIPRNNAIHFVIDNKAYVGLGYNFNDDEYLTDLWSYDPTLNSWQRVADFPAAGRTSAVAFAVNGKGYVGTGYDGNDDLKDFWEYDPVSNSWTQKADFAGTARRGAVGFALGTLGYIGTGNDGNDLKDFWQYDSMTDTWEQIISLGGDKRENAFAFVLNGRAYVGGGRSNGVFEDDFWEYDPTIANWIRKEDLDTDDYNISREGAVAFVINGRGFMGTGSTGAALRDIWEYDPVSDIWDEKTEFEGVPRTEAIGFAIGSLGYICTGRNSNERYDDLWEFDPEAEFDDED